MSCAPRASGIGTIAMQSRVVEVVVRSYTGSKLGIDNRDPDLLRPPLDTARHSFLPSHDTDRGGRLSTRRSESRPVWVRLSARHSLGCGQREAASATRCRRSGSSGASVLGRRQCAAALVSRSPRRIGASVPWNGRQSGMLPDSPAVTRIHSPSFRLRKARSRRIVLTASLASVSEADIPG